ncbi:hypothetical protein LIER_02668 [Lithospermum erythrorhizon]|uniref:Uncharacterized protein n=1 Tax=Lithospermum erythrorhizon TaxID=34254 RepID=A0AAV3NRE3_LITER
MGSPQESGLDLASTKNISSTPFWIQLLEVLVKRTSPKKKGKSKRSRTIMKRRARLERNRRSSSRNGRNEFVKKVKVLKKLVPNCESRRMETLFQETADYIMALQMRVKVMQIMVNTLQGSDEEY